MTTPTEINGCDRCSYVRKVGHVVWHVSGSSGLPICGEEIKGAIEESVHVCIGQYLCTDCYKTITESPPRVRHDSSPVHAAPIGIFKRKRRR